MSTTSELKTKVLTLTLEQEVSAAFPTMIHAAGATDVVIASDAISRVQKLFDGALFKIILRMLPVDNIIGIIDPIVRGWIGNDELADLVMEIVRGLIEQLKGGL